MPDCQMDESRVYHDVDEAERNVVIYGLICYTTLKPGLRAVLAGEKSMKIVPPRSAHRFINCHLSAPPEQKNVRQKNGVSYFSVLHFSV
jgi:hypothetical protein